MGAAGGLVQSDYRALWDLPPHDLDLLNSSFGVLVCLEGEKLGGWVSVFGQQLDGPHTRQGSISQQVDHPGRRRLRQHRSFHLPKIGSGNPKVGKEID